MQACLVLKSQALSDMMIDDDDDEEDDEDEDDDDDNNDDDNIKITGPNTGLFH